MLGMQFLELIKFEILDLATPLTIKTVHFSLPFLERISAVLS